MKYALPQNLKSHPRQWVDFSDPTYSEGSPLGFFESHQRELVDGSDPSFSAKLP